MANEYDLRRRKALADAMAGLTGALVALWAFYPLDMYKTNLQADLVSFRTKYSFSRWYRGIGSKTLHSASSSFVYFYLESWLMTWFTMQKHRNRSHSHNTTGHTNLSPMERLLVSAIAAMLNTIITLPLDVISSLHQTSPGSDDHDDSKSIDRSSITTTVEETRDDAENDCDVSSGADLIEEEKKIETDEIMRSSSFVRFKSVGLLWKGLLPSLLLCSNPSIHFTVFDVLKYKILSRRHQGSKLPMTESFMLGLLSKLTATMVTYPLIRLKVMLMVTHRKSLLCSLVEEYNRQGIRGLYKGCNLQMAHTVLKSALLMMIREKINATTYAWMVSSDEPRTKGHL